ncbi:MAG: nicotinate phosphoribosyltransferase, partial [Candidatus Dadabacteria bacterium]|nr:nicotinate phosphoribosyltransferase [Candidatus Dadabacteria bacterium]
IITQIEEEAPRYGVEPDSLIKRLVYGVGTRLITSKGDSALDGVYKLVSVKEDGKWVPAIKISETPKKTLNPGNKLAWRISDKRGKATADLLTVDGEEVRGRDALRLRHPFDISKLRVLGGEDISAVEPLLVTVLDEGKLVCDLPSIEEMRALRISDIERLDPGVRRIMNPHFYHVSLSEKLWSLKHDLIQSVENGEAKVIT